MTALLLIGMTVVLLLLGSTSARSTLRIRTTGPISITGSFLLASFSSL